MLVLGEKYVFFLTIDPLTRDMTNVAGQVESLGGSRQGLRHWEAEEDNNIQKSSTESRMTMREAQGAAQFSATLFVAVA